MITIPEDMRVGSLHSSNESGNVLITNYINQTRIYICFLNTGNEIKSCLTTIRNGKALDKREKYRKRSEGIANAKSCVYLISYIGTKFIKIGWSGNINQRIKALSYGSPHELVVSKTFECNSKEKAKGLESTVHGICKKYHFKREWFIADDIDLFIEFIEAALARRIDVKTRGNVSLDNAQHN